MPRPKKSVPSYQLHKQSGQTIVTVNVNGTRQDMLLGKYDSAESKREYQRVLADLEAGRFATGVPTDITVNELCNQYWKFAQDYYRDPGGKPTTEVLHFKYAIRVFRDGIGDTPAREFGPLAFKAMRERMIAKKWTRTTVNKQCGRVKRIIRWGVENELLPADRWEALRAVRGLATGRTTARESEPIEPVSEEHFRAVLPHIRPAVAALLEFMSLTGCRPGEACRIRPCDIDTTGEVWIYRPEHHKTRYRGKKRTVPIGTRAQEVLKKFAPVEAGDHYFSPVRAMVEVFAERSVKRKTPRYPSHMKRNQNKRKENPKRRPGRAYTPHGVGVAVARGCQLASITPWHPNQLRHLHGTEVRRRYGLEAAQVVLGHERADVTQIYAEKNLALAVKVAAEMG